MCTKFKDMSNNKQSIHDFDLNIIYEYFASTERQGPGNSQETLKALSFIDGLTENSKIADIGCGTGGQTMTLGTHTSCEIIGVDIWSEGSIYNIGFERGLAEWRKFLKPGGYIAITENTWFREEQPQEIKNFWEEAYPQIDTIPTKVAQMQKAGYLPVATYMLPETIWTDYYKMQAANGESFLKKYKGNKTVEEFIASQRYEAELYDKYKAYYGYMFYIGKKL